ncbi:MAG: protein kinase domain-containing protein, partial [Candidatus Acidiferrales bacterium]
MAERKTAGRYELLEELGRGAMGIVYRAHDPRIGRAVAVKTMRLREVGAGMGHDELAASFDTETKAAGRLTHPNIVVIYDAGEDGGLFYITMEFVQGRSLQALIEQKQGFPLPRIVRLMEQAGSALDFALQHSIVLRDIKPANMLLTADDTLKVTDFGTAKILQKGATQTGAILGTPSYMSPEQVKGKPVDGRSDIFSLGVILYELVTGEKPFPGQNVTTVIYKIVNEEPIPPRDIDTSVHPGLSYVILRALSKNPESRYQTCKELVDDLKNYKALDGFDAATVIAHGLRRPKEVEEAIARSRPAAAAVPSPMSTMPVAPMHRGASEAAASRTRSPRPITLPPLTASLPYSPAEETKSRAGLWAMLSLLILGLLGAAGYFMWPDIREILRPALTEAAQSQPPDSWRAQLARRLLGLPSPPVPAEVDPSQPIAAPEGMPPVPPVSDEAKQPAKSEEVAAVPKASAPTPAERNAQEIQRRLDAAGLGDRVQASVSGGDVTLTGTLTASEARRLRARFRRLPGKMRLVDRLEVAPAPAASSAAPPGAEKPRAVPRVGGLAVVADQLGATISLRGPNGQAFPQRTTPGRYDDLLPGRYTLEVSKAGFRTERRILTIRAGRTETQQ